MKVIIFDMDGTLIDSSKAIEYTINEIRKDMGLKPLDREYIVKAINEPGRNLAYDLYGIEKPSSSLKAGFEKEFKKNYDLYARAYVGVKELLKKCKDSGYKVVLASNAPSSTLIEILIKNEIYDFFDKVIGVDHDMPEKPNPKMLFTACEKTGLKRAVFVGDSLKDEAAAINANMPYIHVSWGFGTKESDSTFVAKDADEIWEIIESKI